MFRRKHHKPQPEQQQPTLTVGVQETVCIYGGQHNALGHDGWQHATAYHDMLCLASAGRWMTVLGDTTWIGHNGTTTVRPALNGDLMSAPLTCHPTPYGRACGHIAIAVAAHELAEQARRADAL